MPIVFAESRQLAEEWTYRYLAAAHAWAETEAAVVTRLGIPVQATETSTAPDVASPSTAEVRAWARSTGITVPRPRLAPPRHLGSLARRPPVVTTPAHHKITNTPRFVRLLSRLLTQRGPFERCGALDPLGRPVVACYGHGGAGVTMSWGCADEVAALIAD